MPTAAHCLRVSLGVSAWGLTEKLKDREQELIEVAALLHDLGKIAVADSILQKPAPLTYDEQAVMELQSKVGVEILRATGASEDLIEVISLVLTKFNQMPSAKNHPKFNYLAAQMVLIADAFDSMTTSHVYRPALGQAQALDELLKNSGTQFNPKLVRSFARSMTSRPLDIEQKLRDRWLGGFFVANSEMPAVFTQVASLNLNAMQQSLTSTFRNQLLDTMKDGVIFVDLENQILEWNGTAEKLTSILRPEVLQRTWSCDILSLRTANGIRVRDADWPFRFVRESKTPMQTRLEIRRPEGDAVMIEADFVPVFDSSLNLCGVALYFRDASDQINLEQHVQSLHERATRDPLTKSVNRAELNRRLPEFVIHHQLNGEPGSLIICDIDFFKRINDTYGHPAGDAALISFAAILREMTRDSDLVARYGGEEFVILCPNCTIEMAIETAERIRNELQNRPLPALRSACLSASFGVATLQTTDTHETLLNRADRALLMAKEGGRNRVMQLDELPVKTARKEAIAQPGWLGWLSGSGQDVIISKSLLVQVPFKIAIEKIRGFVAERNAEVTAVDHHRLNMKVDTKNLPVVKRDSERPATFGLQLVLREIEGQMSERTKQHPIQTLIDIEIQAAKNRDRRSQNIFRQADQLRADLQAYLAASQVDSDARSKFNVLQGPPLN